jgi:hypothetical protein
VQPFFDSPKKTEPRSIEYLFKKLRTTWPRKKIKNPPRKKRNSFDPRYLLSFTTYYLFFKKKILKDSLPIKAPLTTLSTSRRANQLPSALSTLCQTLNYRPFRLI